MLKVSIYIIFDLLEVVGYILFLNSFSLLLSLIVMLVMSLHSSHVPCLEILVSCVVDFLLITLFSVALLSFVSVLRISSILLCSDVGC